VHQHHLLSILSNELANTIQAVLHQVQCEAISFLNIAQFFSHNNFQIFDPPAKTIEKTCSNHNKGPVTGSTNRLYCLSTAFQLCNDSKHHTNVF
jgi:hypothetical protein